MKCDNMKSPTLIKGVQCFDSTNGWTKVGALMYNVTICMWVVTYMTSYHIIIIICLKNWGLSDGIIHNIEEVEKTWWKRKYLVICSFFLGWFCLNTEALLLRRRKGINGCYFEGSTATKGGEDSQTVNKERIKISPLDKHLFLDYHSDTIYIPLMFQNYTK